MSAELATLCTARCSELPAAAAVLEGAPTDAARRVAVRHLVDPTRPATELAAAIEGTLDDVRAGYRLLRNSSAVAALTSSMFYPHRLRYCLAAQTVAEWTAEPVRLQRLLVGEPILSKTVEIHPSRGSCNYSCAMCLWSDKATLTYANQDLQGRGLLSLDQWIATIRDLAAGGVETLVVSGGGEALLNPELPAILRNARQLGLRTQLYTTGFNLGRGASALWNEVARMRQVRLSIHSPTEATYAEITGLPAKHQALRRVSDHATQLLERRDRLASPLRLGIGFVLLGANHDQILAMVDFAAELGVDFLDIRKDEVDVTDNLSSHQLAIARRQLVAARERAARGRYGTLRLDISDELVSLANGHPVDRHRTDECRAKYFRPTISPYGILAPCDLKAEPRFAAGRFNLAMLPQPIDEMVDAMGRTFVPDACRQCMPSSRTGNAVYAKLLTDAAADVPLCEQPFLTATAVDVVQPVA